LSKVGSFDFVIAKHRPLSAEIEDFAVVEFQTGQTTSTGALARGFQDLMEGVDVSARNYNFGLNHYDIWKRTFTQVLNKGIILQKWQKKIFWVVQEPVFQYFEQRYHMSDLGYRDEFSTVFGVYDLRVSGDIFQLAASRTLSASIEDLFSRFRNYPDVPSVAEFTKKLQRKMAHEPQLALRLAGTIAGPVRGPKAPSATGRVREDPAAYQGASDSQTELELE